MKSVILFVMFPLLFQAGVLYSQSLNLQYIGLSNNVMVTQSVGIKKNIGKVGHIEASHTIYYSQYYNRLFHVSSAAAGFQVKTKGIKIYFNGSANFHEYIELDAFDNTKYKWLPGGSVRFVYPKGSAAYMYLCDLAGNGIAQLVYGK